jgi:hypothetical protein
VPHLNAEHTLTVVAIAILVITIANLIVPVIVLIIAVVNGIIIIIITSSILMASSSLSKTLHMQHSAVRPGRLNDTSTCHERVPENYIKHAGAAFA